MALQADYLKQMRTITECTAAIARVRDSKKVAHGGSGGGSYTKPQKQTMRDHDKKIAAALNRINGIKEVRIMANQLDFGALRSIMGTADAAPRCAAVPLGRPVTECQDLNSLDPNDPDIDDDELERDMCSDGGVGGGSGVGGGGGGGEEEEEEEGGGGEKGGEGGGLEEGGGCGGDTAIKYIRAGLLSDPPAMAMYVAIGKTRDGIIIYRCLRTSSSVEGYHQHLSRCISACAKSAGTVWLDLLRQKFDYLWTVRELRRIGWYNGCCHCDIALADRLHTLANSLGAMAYTGGWKCTPVPEDKDSIVRHGAHYASVAMQERFNKAQKQLGIACAGSSSGSGGGGAAAHVPRVAEVAEIDDFLRRVKCVPTAGNIDALLADEQLTTTAQSLMKRAAALGLSVPKEAAKTMLERWLYAEKAYQVVKEKGLLTLKAKLAMPGVSMNMRDAVLPVQPSIGQAHGVTRLVLPPQLVAAGTTTVKQCVREEQEGDGGVIMASAAEEDAAREAAAKKEQARKKAVDNRREKRRQQSRDKGVDKPGAYGKAGVKKKHKSSSD
jgi:hypothetical protein